MPPTHKIRICVDNKKTVPERAEPHKLPRELLGYLSSLRAHSSTGQSGKAQRDNKAAESIPISFHERQLLSHFHGAKMRLTRDRESGCDKKGGASIVVEAPPGVSAKVSVIPTRWSKAVLN